MKNNLGIYVSIGMGLLFAGLAMWAILMAVWLVLFEPTELGKALVYAVISLAASKLAEGFAQNIKDME